ncbi:transporter substrate-binding domain-containing protein [Metallococcus carri]|uniref:transporter substrate-binding domain-containing protein n=1 Tax=Metallococcus carri TaxID=1656884 RepID=UPI002E2C57A7|nr:transporter substrate-binding domain-containing protein [Metallococcus carri]
MCTTGDYRPFSYLDPKTKQRSGIDVTMVQNLATSLEVPIEWVPTTWKTLMPDFTRKCDIAVGGVSISTERAQKAFFSDPVVTEGKTPITLCSNVSKYSTVAQINQPGVRAITPEGGTNEKFARANFPKAKIIVWGDNNTIFDQIIAGKADVMTTDASETVWVANTQPKLCAVHPQKPFNFSQKAYLLPRGDVAWQEYVNEWLNIARHDGTWAAATKPWFGATRLG